MSEPISSPLYIWRESVEIISPFISCAILREIAVLPLAVGPRRTTSGFLAVFKKDVKSLRIVILLCFDLLVDFTTIFDL